MDVLGRSRDDVAAEVRRAAPADRDVILAGLEAERDRLAREEGGWGAGYFPGARDEQRPPEGDWQVWVYRAGRGAGKTRAGAEWLADQAKDGGRWVIVAPTYADCRDTCVEGESGLLAVLDRRKIAHTWNRSMGELTVGASGIVKLHAAERPDRLRGPQWHGGWVDELAAMPYSRAMWDNLTMGARLGKLPKLVVTTTPRPVAIVRELHARAIAGRGDVIEVIGSTYDNAANLPAAMLDDLRRRYEGTRVGRQELHAEIIDDVEGALWSWEMIEAARVDVAPELRRIVVAVDPSWGTKGDEVGIIVAGVGWDRRGYVLDDRSGRMPPAQWGAVAAAAYREWEADRLIAEANFAAEQVRLVMQLVDPTLPYKEVHASRGKQQRAEPVVALYEQGKISHVGRHLGSLEAEMTSWVPDDKTLSPAHVDSLVWAMTELMLDGSAGPDLSGVAAMLG